jgi:ATP-binding cassette subfamily B protein
MRMYDVDAGSILINGQDIRSVDEKDLRRQFGVVFQNDALFSYSIKENIAFGRDLGDNQLIEAAEYAQARDFIEQLQDQYEAKVLRAGANFSGGQKQRMLIARALADNPEIIILDDASSALDYQTDASLRRAIKDSYHATAIIITQRVASVIHADQILMIDEGRIIGLGTHAELLASCEPYYELTQLQLGGDHHEL